MNTRRLTVVAAVSVTVCVLGLAVLNLAPEAATAADPLCCGTINTFPNHCHGLMPEPCDDEYNMCWLTESRMEEDVCYAIVDEADDEKYCSPGTPGCGEICTELQGVIGKRYLWDCDDGVCSYLGQYGYAVGDIAVMLTEPGCD